MDLPSLPTDNLYKFIAITGIVVALGPGFVLNKDLERIDELLRQTRGEEIVLQARIQNETQDNSTKVESLQELRSKIMQLKQSVGEAETKEIALQEKLRAFPPGSPQVEKLQAELGNVQVAAKSLAKETEIVLAQLGSAANGVQETTKEALVLVVFKAELDAKRASIADLEDRYSNKHIWYSIYTFGGGVIAMLGFRFWYHRVQKFEDQLLIAELDEKRNDATARKDSTAGGVKTV